MEARRPLDTVAVIERAQAEGAKRSAQEPEQKGLTYIGKMIRKPDRDRALQAVDLIQPESSPGAPSVQVTDRTQAILKTWTDVYDERGRTS